MKGGCAFLLPHPHTSGETEAPGWEGRTWHRKGALGLKNFCTKGRDKPAGLEPEGEPVQAQPAKPHLALQAGIQGGPGRSTC